MVELRERYVEVLGSLATMPVTSKYGLGLLRSDARCSSDTMLNVHAAPLLASFAALALRVMVATRGAQAYDALVEPSIFADRGYGCERDDLAFEPATLVGPIR